jgi:hypothetical protein
MELINVTIGDVNHKIIKDKIRDNYQVVSQFKDDMCVEIFNFETLAEAKNHLDNEVNTHIEMLANLEEYLILALEKAEILNLDISENINEILNKLKI